MDLGNVLEGDIFLSIVETSKHSVLPLHFELNRAGGERAEMN